MTLEQLRAIIGQTPFQPFVVHLADGREIPVPHRDFIWQPPGSARTFVVADEDDGTFEVVDLLLVTSLEVQQPGKQSKKDGRGNGKKKGGK